MLQTYKVEKAEDIKRRDTRAAYDKEKSSLSKRGDSWLQFWHGNVGVKLLASPKKAPAPPPAAAKKSSSKATALKPTGAVPPFLSEMEAKKRKRWEIMQWEEKEDGWYVNGSSKTQERH